MVVTQMAKKLTIKQSKIETETLIAIATSDTLTEASVKLGIQRNTLYDRIAKYGLAEQLANIQEVAKAELLTATGKAARNIVAKIDHEDPNISMKASTETLDRAGITKPNEKRTDATINNFGQLLIQQKDKYED